MFFQTVYQRNGELVVHHVLFGDDDQPEIDERKREKLIHTIAYLLQYQAIIIPLLKFHDYFIKRLIKSDQMKCLALFTWSRIPETTLSPTIIMGEIFFHSFVQKILSTVYMKRARQLGEGSCLASAGRVTPRAGETTFSQVNRSDRPPGTRQQKLKLN